MPEQTRRRAVRSFVKRAGRTTRAQHRALRDLLPKYALDTAARPLTGPKIFGRRAPLVLEIGFGNGDTLAELAVRHPEKDFIGVEVHEPGVGHLLLQVESHALTNVKVAVGDAVELLESDFADEALDEVLILFPDPWPKKRHHKRRLVQPDLLTLLAAKMRHGGLLHMATDWEPYAEHMRECVEACPWFDNLATEAGFVPRPNSRPATKFERRGQRLGHKVWDLQCLRNRAEVPAADAKPASGAGAGD